MSADEEAINSTFSHEMLAALRKDMMRFAQLQLRDGPTPKTWFKKR